MTSTSKNYHPGAYALTLFAPAMRSAIVDFVNMNGATALTETQECAAFDVRVDPALGFLSPDTKTLKQLVRALRVIIGDALAGQWTTEDYADALQRAGSLPRDEGMRIATDHIVTRDAGIIDFARRLLTHAPEIPGPFDDAAAWMLGGVFNFLEESLPNDWVNNSEDVLFEWFQLGEQLERLSIRANLVYREAAYEKKALSQGGDGDDDDKQQAMSSIVMLSKALVGVLAKTRETGDTSVDADELTTTMGELGDLLAEGYYLNPEQGSIGSFLKRVGKVVKKGVNLVKKAAPALLGTVANVALPGIGGALVGGLTGALGKAAPDHHSQSAINAAHNHAASLPRAPITATRQNLKVSDLIGTMKQLREAGVGLG
jgi:hypothetical protein